MDAPNLDDSPQNNYYSFKLTIISYFMLAAMVKLVDTLLLGSSAQASRFEFYPPLKTLKYQNKQIG
jgi:hypothetical protein